MDHKNTIDDQKKKSWTETFFPSFNFFLLQFLLFFFSLLVTDKQKMKWLYQIYWQELNFASKKERGMKDSEREKERRRKKKEWLLYWKNEGTFQQMEKEEKEK